jgi:hypothetical protein
MNENLKHALLEATGIICTTIGVTTAAFLTVKLCNKIYGPLEIEVKK